MREYKLNLNLSTHLGINDFIILQSALNNHNLEYDCRKGFIEHLEENMQSQYAKKQYLKALVIDDEVILIKREKNGIQRIIIPHSEEFNKFCKLLINESI